MEFKEYQDKCPWKLGRWCKPLIDVGERVKCEPSECPFWGLRDIIRKEK